MIQISPSLSIFKLYALATRCINRTAAVRAPLLLVLLLGEALALCDNQVGVRAVGVVVGNVGVALELGIDVGVGFDALEAVLDVVLLSLWFFGGGRAGEFALVGGGGDGRVGGEGGGGVGALALYSRCRLVVGT